MFKNKWGILFVTTMATSLVFLDQTVMPVALPTIERELGFSPVGLMWVINAYVLCLAALMVVGGRLYDLFGMRRTYEWGFFLFALGSLIAAMSFIPFILILGRVVQGIGGALMMPTTGAILIETFPPGVRGKALGINSAISSVFLILGPLIGGFFTEYLSWRYIFWINLPLIAAGMWLGRRSLPKGEVKDQRLHYQGALLFAGAVVALVTALMEGEKWGWTNIWTLVGIALFVLLFALFILSNRKAKHPLLDFSLFANPLFRGANICILTTQFILMVNVLWAIYFQEGLSFSPAEAGVLMLVATAPVMFVSPLAGHLFDRIGTKIPVTIGFALLSFSLLWLASHAPFTTLTPMVIGLIPFGCGIPLVFSPSYTVALSHVPKKQIGQASSITTSMRQIASTLAIAVLTAIFQSASHRTGSMQGGFEAISYFGGALAAAGFIVALFVLRPAPH